MNKFFFLLMCVVSLPLFSQTAPDKGDYISIRTAGFDSTVHYIFKNEMVYFGHNPFTNITENAYKQDAKMTKELFQFIDKTGLETIYILNEKKLQLGPEVFNYRIIEYHKSDKVYKVCWDTSSDDENSRKMGDIESKMNGFW